MSESLDVGAGLTLGWDWCCGSPVFGWWLCGWYVSGWDPARAGSWLPN